jgi:protein ImuB
MLWACIALPQLALDGVLRRRADAGPLVLVAGTGHARSVVAANAAAPTTAPAAKSTNIGIVP